jgi:hypothetical protein
MRVGPFGVPAATAGLSVTLFMLIVMGMIFAYSVRRKARTTRDIPHSEEYMQVSSQDCEDGEE